MAIGGRWLFSGILLSLLVSTLSSCGGAVPNRSTNPGDHRDRTPPLIGDWTIGEAQRFDEFAVYWVGEEFRGLPLTSIRRHDTSSTDPPAFRPESSISFMYGTCEPSSDGGCPPPIQIIIEPYCNKAFVRAWENPEPFREHAEISGAEIESSLDVWTGDVAIKIYAFGESGDPRAVAEALVSLNGRGPTEPGAPLPAVSAQCSPFCYSEPPDPSVEGCERGISTPRAPAQHETS